MSQPLLEAHQQYVDDENLISRIEQLEQQVSMLKTNHDLVKRDAVIIVLNLLAKSLKHVASGEFDLDEIHSDSTQPSKWDSIKKRLAPRLAQAIDIITLQGPMKRTQLAAALKMDYSNCTKNVIAVLVRQGLLIEQGGQLTLKEI